MGPSGLGEQRLGYPLLNDCPLARAELGAVQHQCLPAVLRRRSAATSPEGQGV